MNENMRLALALGLTMVVLLLWNQFFPPVKPQSQVSNGTDISAAKAEGPRQVGNKNGLEETRQIHPVVPREQFKAAGKSVTVETPLYKAVFNSQGGGLEGFYLKRYRQTIDPDSPEVKLVDVQASKKLNLGLYLGSQPLWSTGTWSVSTDGVNLAADEQGTVAFRCDLGNLVIWRTFQFSADSYLVKEQVKIGNKSVGLVSSSLDFTLFSPHLVAKENRYNQTNIVYLSPTEGLKKESDKDDLKAGLQAKGAVNWAGVESNYFLLAMVPLSDGFHFFGKLEGGLYQVTLDRPLTLGPGKESVINMSYYLGPKLESYLKGAPNHLDKALNYGWLDFLSKPLITVLNFFYNYVGNYGLAIIILTIVIKIIFWPLSHKSYKSMEQMKKIQPLMQKLKEKYKDDRQKMNQELMRLYKTYKVNPAGGCLPMLLQIPVFIALYEALMGAIELRHAPFIAHVPFTNLVWLADLSAKDPYYVTPLLMGLTTFLQQKLSPSAGDPTQAKIMMIMPVFLTFIFLNFPSGLVVYFITNNVLSIAQQWWILRKA